MNAKRDLKLLLAGLAFVIFALYMCKNLLNDSNVVFDNVNEKNKTSSISAELLDLTYDPNKYVDKYITKPLDFTWGSNVIPLLFAALATEGNLLGKFS